MAEETAEPNVQHPMSNIPDREERQHSGRNRKRSRAREEVPDIMRGKDNPFEEKMKEGVLLAPVEEKHYIEEKPKPSALPEPEKPKVKYQGFDPYKEPIE